MATLELFPISGSKPVISGTSRFNFNSVYRLEDGTTFMQTWKPRQIPKKETDQTLVITKRLSFRPDLISDQVYGTPLLAWAICYVNDILNPLDRKTGMYVGRLLRIPDPSTIYGTGT